MHVFPAERIYAPGPNFALVRQGGAASAADWTLTFRWQYNVHFDRRTFLGNVDFRTVGADLASPSNQYLHTYGLIALPEWLCLWQATADDLYFHSARDLLGFARQTLARGWRARVVP